MGREQIERHAAGVSQKTNECKGCSTAVPFYRFSVMTLGHPGFECRPKGVAMTLL